MVGAQAILLKFNLLHMIRPIGTQTFTQDILCITGVSSFFIQQEKSLLLKSIPHDNSVGIIYT